MAFSGESFGRTLYRNRAGLVIGGLIGLYSGGFVGMLFGAVVGLWAEKGLKSVVKQHTPQQLFFRATFTVMGKLAKADGRVSENEIEFARAVMQQMRLSDDKRREAMGLFNEGKAPDFDLTTVLRPLAVVVRSSSSLKLMFVEIQLQAALADGEISQAEAAVIQEVCDQLQFTQYERQVLLERLKAAQNFRDHQQSGGDGSGRSLGQAYGVLGVSEEASDAEIKRAWRKLMSQHHPDKLVAKGLPTEMIELAKEKTQEIQNAYDQIKAARGMR